MSTEHETLDEEPHRHKWSRITLDCNGRTCECGRFLPLSPAQRARLDEELRAAAYWGNL